MSDQGTTTVVIADDHAIVVLTMHDDSAFARQALRNGPLGFVLKEAADDELLEAVRLAARRETYVHPSLGARLAAERPAGDLTEREIDALEHARLESGPR